MIKDLIYDTKLFNYKVASLSLNSEFDLDKIEESIKVNNIKLLYIFPKDEKCKFKFLHGNLFFVDTKIVFEKKVERPIILDNINVRSFTENDSRDELLELALISGKYSRFKTDKNFKNGEYEKLYFDWINKSIEKQIADDVLIFEVDNEILGFITYKKHEEFLTIGLIAVKETAQKKGIGKLLLNKINEIAFSNSIDKIVVSTQLENNIAMNFYHSRGFNINKKQKVFHLWI